MPTYAIGDVQGCYDELRQLLDTLRFDPGIDTVWFTGDLVNRGPDSLATLRFVKQLGAHAVTVLGNHDLHLLAVAHGHLRYHRKDSFHDVLIAPDRDELLDWLRHQPLLHHDAGLGYTMIHAGLPPQWDFVTAQRCAAELEETLRGKDYVTYLGKMYGNEPDRWSETLTGWKRLRFITNCFTRLRFCDGMGRLALEEKGAPGSQPAGYRPWFTVPGRASADLKLVFGHWSTLGPCAEPNVFPLDTGCLWGGKLTALRLDGPPQWVSIDCPGARRPGTE
jgi:bis(5'-nucleosyl)-tetraphosphatase (symmetrical)